MSDKTVDVTLSKEEISAILVAIDADLGNVHVTEYDFLEKLYWKLDTIYKEFKKETSS
jgi:hypothetical protein